MRNILIIFAAMLGFGAFAQTNIPTRQMLADTNGVVKWPTNITRIRIGGTDYTNLLGFGLSVTNGQLSVDTTQLPAGGGGGGGSGTVTSVGASTTVSGLGFSGSPVTESGTLSLTGTVAVASGGTGATDVPGARTALSLVPGVDVQAYDVDLAAIAALANSGIIVRTGSGTVAARTITGDTEAVVNNGDGVSGNPTLSIGAAIARDAEVAAAYQPLDADLTAMAAGTAVATAQTNAVSMGAPVLYVGTTNVAAALAACGGGGLSDGGSAASLTVTNLATESINGHWYYDVANGDQWSDGDNVGVSVATAFLGWTSSPLGGTIPYLTNSTPDHPFVIVSPTTTAANDGNRYYTQTVFSTAYAETGSGWEFIVNLMNTNGTVGKLGFMDQAGTTIPTDGAYVSFTNGIAYATSRSNSITAVGSTAYQVPINTWLKFRGICTSSNVMAMSAITDSGSIAWSDTVTGLPNVPGREFGHAVAFWNTNSSMVSNLFALDALGVKWGVR